MSGLTATDLAWMRTVETGLLDGTCTVRPKTGEQAWGAGSAVACRIAAMSAETVQTYLDRLGAASGWVFTLPYGTACVPGNTITAAGLDYDVLGTNAGESNQTCMRAYCGRTR